MDDRELDMRLNKIEERTDSIIGLMEDNLTGTKAIIHVLKGDEGEILDNDDSDEEDEDSDDDEDLEDEDDLDEDKNEIVEVNKGKIEIKSKDD